MVDFKKANAKPKKNLPLDFDKIFDDFMASQQKTWMYDRNKTLGASEAFGCMRQAFFKKHEYEEDEDHEQRWGATRRGDLIENHHVVPAFEFLPKEYEALGMGDEQETLVDGLLSATPDGLLIDLPKHALSNYGIDDIESDCIVLEVKSIDPRVHLKEEKAIHRGQTQAQMGLIRKLTDFQPMYAVIMYIDASFLDDIEYFVVKFDQKSFDTANRRAAKIYKAKDPMDMKPEGLITGACQYCAFQKRCKELMLGSIPENENPVDDKALARMAKLVEKKQKANERQKKAEAAHKEATFAVKEFLRKNDVRRMGGDDFSVSHSAVKGRVSYDYKAMEEDGIDLEEYKKTGAGYDKLTITIKDKD